MNGATVWDMESAAARLDDFVELLETALLRSQLRGDPGNWYALRRTLRATATNMPNKRALRADRASQIEMASWIDCLSTYVLPHVLDRVVEEINGARYRWGDSKASGGHEIWAPLSAGGLAEATTIRDGAAAEAALLRAYRQHRHRASAPRMHDAIQALKDLCEQTALPTSRYGPAVLSAEGEYLFHALDTVFPPTARLVLSSVARLLFEEAVESEPVHQLPESRANDWYRKYPGLKGWRPLWVTVNEDAWKEPCEDNAPILFVPEAQQVYVTKRERRDRDKKGQEGT